MATEKFKIIGKLTAEEQFLIMKRLSSPHILPFVDMMLQGEKNSILFLPAISMALNKMSDEDALMVRNVCLSKVHDISSTPSSAVFRNGVMMNDDLSLSDMLNFTSEIIMRDMRDFLLTVLPNLAQA